MFDASNEQINQLREIFGAYGSNGLARACAKMLAIEAAKEIDESAKRITLALSAKFAGLESNVNPFD